MMKVDCLLNPFYKLSVIYDITIEWTTFKEALKSNKFILRLWMRQLCFLKRFGEFFNIKPFYNGKIIK